MKLVLSASRRTDLVAGYPNQLVEILKKYPPEQVHSVVLWTKKAGNLIHHRALRESLLQYDQLFLHFSITGMGGTLFEPGIPRTAESLSLLPALIQLTGSPERISIRFDPIVNVKVKGKRYTNLEAFPEIAQAAQRHSIRRITTSWMSSYKKLFPRLGPRDIELMEFDWRSQADQILHECSKRSLQLNACCVEGLAVSRCIDGPLLSALHPRGEKCSLAKASGQRPLCGCTASKDIGWYSMVCPGGCLYCYANPADLTTHNRD